MKQTIQELRDLFQSIESQMRDLRSHFNNDRLVKWESLKSLPDGQEFNIAKGVISKKIPSPFPNLLMFETVFAPNSELQSHHHDVEEIISMIDGMVELNHGKTRKPPQIEHIPPYSIHHMKSKEGARMLVFFRHN